MLNMPSSIIKDPKISREGKKSHPGFEKKQVDRARLLSIKDQMSQKEDV
jgi:hypothetical protein